MNSSTDFRTVSVAEAYAKIRQAQELRRKLESLLAQNQDSDRSIAITKTMITALEAEMAVLEKDRQNLQQRWEKLGHIAYHCRFNNSGAWSFGEAMSKYERSLSDQAESRPGG
ncbi:MAG: hypothetical protein M1383_05665 [Patescibacteria group bacterium]|nr:hypothetical protein [Patescibacteria group bacterium]